MPPPELSARHRDCLRLAAEGLTSAMIARRLQISPHTVDQYFEEARRRLAARTRAHALALAIRRGLL
jgi:DNA-binding CsgD family transcriptional regulator